MCELNVYICAYMNYGLYLEFGGVLYTICIFDIESIWWKVKFWAATEMNTAGKCDPLRLGIKRGYVWIIESSALICIHWTFVWTYPSYKCVAFWWTSLSTEMTNEWWVWICLVWVEWCVYSCEHNSMNLPNNIYHKQTNTNPRCHHHTYVKYNNNMCAEAISPQDVSLPKCHWISRYLVVCVNIHCSKEHCTYTSPPTLRPPLASTNIYPNNNIALAYIYI